MFFSVVSLMLRVNAKKGGLPDSAAFAFQAT
jgi:hypothetical protein